MFEVIVCDDNKEFLYKIEKLIYKYAHHEKIDISVKLFEALEMVSFESISRAKIIFLDVEMGEKTGVEFAAEIRTYNKNVVIVFISSYVEYAPFGYNVNAYRYILKKDIDYLFENCMSDILIYLNKKRETFTIKNNSDEVKINLSNIIYIASYGRKLMVKTNDINEYSFYSSINKIEKQLVPKGFIRLQRSFLVNMKYIIKISKGIAFLANGEQITISRDKYSDIKDKYISFRGE